MGSKPCFCESPKSSIQEINIIIHQLTQIPANAPQKPIPLQMVKSLKEEDDFGLFLVMEQYERLLIKHNKRIKSTSPSHQIENKNQDIKTTYNLKKHTRKVDLKKSKSLTNTKISTSSKRSSVKSILKKKSAQNQISYEQQISAPQRSIKSVHFDFVQSPINIIQRQSLTAKKKVYLRSDL
ncbi:unnamed protein product [Paramecium sonneborni]|uniref:Uncharacterized protein n=1 Tax=Paramecium sonneborni TaxID=65129 RepID=A0A8S1MJE1_9CILI|nr:unnamed protein product [Paramecium sonneborni]